MAYKNGPESFGFNWGMHALLPFPSPECYTLYEFQLSP
jgi:hypothetical protein